jgi:hypothetical protein
MSDAFSDQSRDPGVSETPASTSRALVPLTLPAATTAPGSSAFRPDARFVAHLIATATHAPQTRTLRRAAPGDVVTTYSGASTRDDLPVAANGVVLSRVA